MNQVISGQVSMIGVHFEDEHVATGFGNHLARPILRDEWHENLSFEDGVKLLEKCMRVLLYRDRSAVNKLQVCSIVTFVCSLFGWLMEALINKVFTLSLVMMICVTPAEVLKGNHL